VKSVDGLSIASMEGSTGLTSRTTTLLHATTSYFDRMQRDRNGQCPVAESPKTSSSPDSRSRRRFGVAPWHRRRSHDSLFSVSSSVHNLLMGKTPVATPALEKYYSGPEGKPYPRGIRSGHNC
jgi:parafibromin